MKRLRTFTVATSACLIAAVAPSSALAGPLLSGYGGPGQGNQVILGSALLGGPGEGSGGGSGGAPGAGGSQESTTQASSAPEPAASGGSAGSPRPHRSAHKAGGGASKPAQRANTPRPFTSTADVGSETLGLSGTDVLYVLLGLALLIMTAVATRMLARRAP